MPDKRRGPRHTRELPEVPLQKNRSQRQFIVTLDYRKNEIRHFRATEALVNEQHIAAWLSTDKPNARGEKEYGIMLTSGKILICTGNPVKFKELR